MARRWLLVAALLGGFALLFALSSPVEAILLQGTFIDDNNSPHQNGIEAVAAKQITVGCNPPVNDMFCPNRDVTRAEAATFLARALSLPSDGNDYFVDDDGHILEGAINKLAAAGITQGCNPPANDRFCPDRSLTRAEFATFIVRALSLPQTSVDYFDDDDGHILESAINRIAEQKITVGCNPPTNNHFCPNRALTRGETATLLTRALNLPHNPQRIPLSNWNPIDCDKDGIQCNLNVETFDGRTHHIEEGFFNVLPYKPGEEAALTSGATTFKLFLNGSELAGSQLPVSSSSTAATRRWTILVTFAPGDHILVGEWRWNGTLIMRTTAFIEAN
ncbi:MAG: S-layer homology domain-containing protein [Acidimicrobiia bacterium]